MPLPIDVKPYTLSRVLGGDNYLTHYQGLGTDGEEFVITEFYPKYMVIRNTDDDSTLDVSERFNTEYLDGRDEFVKRANAVQDIRDVSLHPVVEVFERNHTAYMVRKMCGMTTLDQYMGAATMDFDEAFHFMRPLFVSLAQAADKGMQFNINPNDFRVNSYKQLVLCSPPSWDTDFHAALTQLIKTYYKLVTGTEPPAESAPAISAYGVEIPPRVEAMVMEIMAGDILYGSLDDFYKKFKSLIDGSTETSAGDGKKGLAAMRWAAAILFVVFALSLVGLAYGLVEVHRANTFWANPDVFAEDKTIYYTYDFSGVSLTHPRNLADTVTGSFGAYDGFLFIRGDGGMYSRLYGGTVFVPGAMGVAALADNRLVVPGAMPAFIVGHGSAIFGQSSRVYFSDTANNSAIFRMTTAGDDLEQITEYPALNLQVVGNYLFYTHVEDNHHLWRYDINQNTHMLIDATPVFATASSGSTLFYVAQAPHGASLYAWDMGADPQTRIRITTDINPLRSLRIFNSTLFYVDTAGYVNSVTFDGRHIATHSPQNVRTFDVLFQWLVFTEEGRHVPRAYDMNTGEILTLTTTEWVSYLWIHEDQIYGLDHRDPSRTHNFNLLTW